jgi:hypothetical protein
MTLLALPDSRLEVSAKRTHGASSLRAWLAGRWAILFSHPDDFAQEQLEMERWIGILGDTFRGRRVVPVALARAGYDPEQGWLGRLAALSRESAAVLTLDPSSPAAPADFCATALRARLACSGPRFAMIIDWSLRCRRALSYQLRSELPSPLELIGWAVALRKRDAIEPHSHETPEPSLPIGHIWARSGHCAAVQAG